MSDFKRKFSFPHWDGYVDDDIFYRLISNSTPEYRAEIRDIYFGGNYHYEYRGHKRTYGEIMGVASNPTKVDNLFRIQDTLGIPISLTLNTMTMGNEIASDIEVVAGLVQYIKTFYDRGLRITTISAVHLMRTGVLQNEFPEMHWKNTVNHLVKNTQEVHDYAALGYNTILLDRSLNRDLTTLKEIRVESKKLGIETSLLATEGCMPSCPFKKEHDDWQSDLQQSPTNYWETFAITCASWRDQGDDGNLPRHGTDISLATKELVDEFMANVDVLKFSGRLGAGGNVDPNGRMCWSGISPIFEYADSFEEIYDKNLAPFINTRFLPQGWTNLKQTQQHNDEDISSIWNTKKGRGLSKILSNCKNRCWDCHACEKVFGVGSFNSILEQRISYMAPAFLLPANTADPTDVTWPTKPS